MDDLRSGAGRELIDDPNHSDVGGGWARPELPAKAAVKVASPHSVGV